MVNFGNTQKNYFGLQADFSRLDGGANGGDEILIIDDKKYFFLLSMADYK